MTGPTETPEPKRTDSKPMDGDGTPAPTLLGSAAAGEEAVPEGGDGGEGAGAEKAGDESAPSYADFLLPEGMALEPEALAEAVALFGEARLSQELAQKFVDLALGREL